MPMPPIPPATIISVSALLFSFGTTFVSYRRTHTQDIQSSRQELRTLLLRLTTIPRENLEATKKYADDQNTLFGIGQLYNQENTLLSRQAAEIARRLPPKLVSATEYYAIAIALQRAYNLPGAQEFLQLAAEHARDFNDEIGAVRSTANLEYLIGQPSLGRAKYQQALEIFAKYPSYDAYTQVQTHVATHLQWATSEAGSGEMRVADEHLQRAQELAEGVPDSPGADFLRAQVAQTRDQFRRGHASTAPGSFVQLTTQ